MKLSAFVVAAILLPPSAWAVHKCQSADGRVTFQDAPCADGQGVKLKLPERTQPESNAAAELAGQSRLANMRAQNELSAAIREGRPIVGMTVKQLNDALGLATTVNTDTFNGEMREQAIFERADTTWYVYTKNGIVDYVQQRPGPPISHRHNQNQTGARCPTSLEIQNARTAASSISLNEYQRAEQIKRVREMEACRAY